LIFTRSGRIFAALYPAGLLKKKTDPPGVLFLRRKICFKQLIINFLQKIKTRK